MSSGVALPWILAGSTACALGAALLLFASIGRTAREIAERNLSVLDAGEDVLRRLEAIAAEGEPLLQIAAIRPASPELIEALDAFRNSAAAALEQAEAAPRPLRQLGLDELVLAADAAVSAVNRLYDGAARYEPRELMHGEARHASARFSELAAGLAGARAGIEADRKRLLRIARRKRPGFASTFIGRPQISK